MLQYNGWQQAVVRQVIVELVLPPCVDLWIVDVKTLHLGNHVVGLVSLYFIKLVRIRSVVIFNFLIDLNSFYTYIYIYMFTFFFIFLFDAFTS